jgi:hypothetical protein
MEDLLEAMIKHATTSADDRRYGREGILDYIKYGYVPYDKHNESVNLTLDFAYGDYCIAVVARALGKKVGLRPEDAYMQYLAYGKPANSGVGRPTPQEAVDCIHALEGKAVIAHPGRWTMDEETREKTLVSLLEYGADGIEVFYPSHTEREVAYFLNVAKERHLLITGGSDTHVEDGTREIGTPFYTADNRLFELCEIY